MQDIKRIKCSNEKCNKTFAHLLNGKNLDLVRQKQQVTVLGSDYSLVATCGWCQHKTALIVKDGKLDETDVTFKEKSNGKEEHGKQPESGANPDNSNTNGGQSNGTEGLTGSQKPDPNGNEEPTGGNSNESGKEPVNEPEGQQSVPKDRKYTTQKS